MQKCLVTHTWMCSSRLLQPLEWGGYWLTTIPRMSARTIGWPCCAHCVTWTHFISRMMNVKKHGHHEMSAYYAEMSLLRNFETSLTRREPQIACMKLFPNPLSFVTIYWKWQGQYCSAQVYVVVIWSNSITDISYMVLLLPNCSGIHVMCGCNGMRVARVNVWV